MIMALFSEFMTNIQPERESGALFKGVYHRWTKSRLAS